MKFSENIIMAIRDYFYLLEKGYPSKRTLSLVADRYHLDKNESAVLYRGVFTKEESTIRYSRVMSGTPDVKSTLKVDTFNQVYNIISYLEGRLVYIAGDGLLKDASEIHGGPVNSKSLHQALSLMKSFFETISDISVEFYLDQQMNNAPRVKEYLENIFNNSLVDFRIVESDHVDACLAKKGNFILATSDSKIIDRTENTIYDLSRAVLENKFSIKIPDIRLLLSENK